MKSKITERKATELTLKITIESETVNEELDKLYDKTKQELDLPGFRKGKVPKSFLKAKFGDEVFYDDAKEELIKEYLPQALKENDIDPVSEPETDSEEFSRDEDFVFEATVEIMPDVEIGDYTDIDVEDVEPEKVTDDDIQGKIEDLQQENGQLVPKEGKKIEEGDYVTIADPDGNTQQVHVQFAEDEESPLKEFVGKEVGDSLEIAPGEEGDEAEPVELTVQEAKELKLPEIDDEFAKDVGAEDLEALRTKVKTEMFEEREDKRVKELGNQILEKIIEGSGFEPPTKMLENISDNKVNETVDELGEEKFAEVLESGGKTREEFTKDIQQSARDQISQRLVVQKIAELEDIELTDEELEEELEVEANKQGTNPIKLKNQLRAQDQLDSYKDALLKQKVYEFLIDSANIITEEGNDE